MEINDIACRCVKYIAQRGGGLELPYCFAQSLAGNQSSCGLRSLTFPSNGTGFGPGGRGPGADLDFRSQRKIGSRRQAAATRREGLVTMAGEKRGKKGQSSSTGF